MGFDLPSEGPSTRLACFVSGSTNRNDARKILGGWLSARAKPYCCLRFLCSNISSLLVTMDDIVLC